MSNSHTKVHPAAEQLISVPRAHLALELRQDEAGVVLLHEGKPLVECPLTREGMIAAGFLAEALGAKVPALGETLQVRVSTGVLFRAVSISELDFGKEESYVLLQRLLEEAATQRRGSSDAV
ncbi:MAG: hypothetical protein IH956_07250 [Chloroflexi bacterium]|nr:hypothetical protein [Chloroflexota bacterium]